MCIEVGVSWEMSVLFAPPGCCEQIRPQDGLRGAAPLTVFNCLVPLRVGIIDVVA